MSKWLAEALHSGVMGFGLRSYQSEFQSTSQAERKPPSFTTALVEQEVLLPPETGDGETGIIYYFGLRPDTMESFLAPNHWPCADPNDRTLTAGVPSWSAAIPVNSTTRWMVHAISMHFQFKYDTTGLEDGESGGWSTVKDGVYLFQDENGADYIRILLDTGTSLSWLPLSLIRHARQKIFTSESAGRAIGDRNRQLDELQQDSATPMITDAPIPFAGPKSSMLSRWRVKLCFQGYGGRPVDVYTPLDPFVCTTNPQTGESEGLLCAGAPSKTYILGLNFFQSMFVSMHNVSVNNPGLAYVRIAPQWPHEVSNFQLPGGR